MHDLTKQVKVDNLNVEVPQGMEIGYNLERDRERWFVSDEGIVVVPKGSILEP